MPPTSGSRWIFWRRVNFTKVWKTGTFKVLLFFTFLYKYGILGENKIVYGLTLMQLCARLEMSEHCWLVLINLTISWCHLRRGSLSWGLPPSDWPMVWTWDFLKLMIDVEVSKELWVVPIMDRWSWVEQPMKRKPTWNQDYQNNNVVLFAYCLLDYGLTHNRHK